MAELERCQLCSDVAQANPELTPWGALGACPDHAVAVRRAVGTRRAERTAEQEDLLERVRALFRRAVHRIVRRDGTEETIAGSVEFSDLGAAGIGLADVARIELVDPLRELRGVTELAGACVGRGFAQLQEALGPDGHPHAARMWAHAVEALLEMAVEAQHAAGYVDPRSLS